MPTDDEFRRVAEDMRALLRAVSRDASKAMREAARGGHDPRQAWREIAAGARNGLWEGWRSEAPGPAEGGPDGPGSAEPGWERDGSAPPHLTSWPRGRPRPRGRGWSTPVPAHSPSWQRRRRRSRPPLRHRHDSAATLAVLLFAGATLWLLAMSGAARVDAKTVLAAGLVALGTAMVITARTDWSMSRKGWPLALGFAAILALVLVSSRPAPQLTIGDRSFIAEPGQALPAVIHTGVGDATIDLRRLDPTVSAVTIEGIAGDTRLWLPSSRVTQLDATVDGGQVRLDGAQVGAGPLVNIRTRIAPGASRSSDNSQTQAAELQVRVVETFGAIEIHTSTSLPRGSAATPTIPPIPGQVP